MQPHLFDPRPMASVLIDRTWHPCLVRMRHRDGRLNVQISRDGDQFLENVAAEAVVLWD